MRKEDEESMTAIGVLLIVIGLICILTDKK